MATTKLLGGNPITDGDPLPVQESSLGATVIADGVATDTTGVKLSYTVPAGKTARVTGVSWFNTSGTPTVQLQLVRSAATIVIRQDVDSFTAAPGLRLQAGDTIQLAVTVLAVAGTADASISVEESR